jgi:hypothetical protein
MIGHLKSVSTSTNTYCGYRSLWCEVIKQAWYRASIGEQSALTFFNARNGTFSQLCLLLDLPEEQIRKHVLINRKRNSNER